MSDKREKLVRQSLAQLHTENPDFDRVLEAFAEEAIYKPHVPLMKLMVGRAAIKQELQRQFRAYKDCDCEMLACGASGNFVFTERRDHVTMRHNGQRIFSSVCAVFEFNNDDRIVSWREYWDMGDIQRQLELSDEQMQALHHGELNS